MVAPPARTPYAHPMAPPPAAARVLTLEPLPDAAADKDPVLAAFLNAPLADEPETEEERAADLEAIEDWKAGRLRTFRA